MNPKLAGLLGIARRAGHISIGFDAVAAMLKSGRARLVLMANDSSQKTQKELRYIEQEHSCPIHTLPATKSELAAALGLEKPVAAVAIDDRGFAAAMLKHVGTDTKEDIAL